MSEGTYDILRKVGLGLFVVTVLTVFGNSINGIIGGWDKLAEIFALLRALIQPFSYFNDNNAFINFVGYFLSLTSLFWIARGGIVIYKINK